VTIPERIRADIVSQVVAEDGTINYCPDCGLVCVLGSCSHGLGMKVMGAGGYVRTVCEVVSDEFIGVYENEDCSGSYYAYVDVRALSAARASLAAGPFSVAKKDDGSCGDCTAKHLPSDYTPCPACGAECGRAYCAPCPAAALASTDDSLLLYPDGTVRPLLR
jgi:hypothetical protein